MKITLHDPVRPLGTPPGLSQTQEDAVGDRRTLPSFRDELRRMPTMRVPPSAPAEDVRAALRARGGKTSFELASRGGFARTVSGRIASAQTYMVLGDDDELLRVPLRDITSTRETATDDGSKSA